MSKSTKDVYSARISNFEELDVLLPVPVSFIVWSESLPCRKV